MGTKRDLYPDVLRLTSCFAVIILHTAASKWYSTPVNTYSWQVFNIYDSLVRWCVPVFIMVTGIYLLDPLKIIDNKTIFVKYIPRIIWALLFWGFAYGVINTILSGSNWSIKKILVIISKIPFGPAHYHLWYLYMLIGLYILTPIIRIWIKAATKKDIEYALIVFFLFGNLIPLLSTLLFKIDNRLNINFEISETSSYIGYYIAGYYFNRYIIKRKYEITIYILGVLSLLATIIVTSIYSIYKNEPDGYLYGYILPNTMFVSYSVFLIIKNECSLITDKKVITFITKVAPLSFGIYLIHDIFNMLFAKIGLNTLMINAAFSVPLLAILIYALVLY